MSVFDYSGQWVARNETGFPELIVDLDKTKRGSVGSACFYSSNNELPSISSQLTLNTNRKAFSLNLVLSPFDALTGNFLTASDIRNFFPKYQMPNRVEVVFERLDRNELRLSWTNAEEVKASVRLERTALPKVSNLDEDPAVYSWDSFRETVSGLEFKEFAFRGQNRKYPLQTTFLRTNRKCLNRYLAQDVRELHHSVSGHVSHVFNTDAPQDLGALLNLAQHHGFPTPLLDWTYSPFVAAWFAFDGVSAKRRSQSDRYDTVRIYCLNRTTLLQFPQFTNLTNTVPHTSLLDALPIENKRAIPQQGLLMSTNLHDIEDHLFNLGQKVNRELLTAYDIPVFDAEKALNDLAMMGITHSTMMPGIDSMCRDLRNRLFR